MLFVDCGLTNNPNAKYAGNNLDEGQSFPVPTLGCKICRLSRVKHTASTAFPPFSSIAVPARLQIALSLATAPTLPWSVRFVWSKEYPDVRCSNTERVRVFAKHIALFRFILAVAR